MNLAAAGTSACTYILGRNRRRASCQWCAHLESVFNGPGPRVAGMAAGP
jgi:hypothetical protein